jgi:hypothetical protein
MAIPRELLSVSGPFLSPNSPLNPLSDPVDRLLQASGQPRFRKFQYRSTNTTSASTFLELDLWGRVGRQIGSADAQVDQVAEQRCLGLQRNLRLVILAAEH